VIDGADIVATFNGNLGTPGCLEASKWYYGLDNKANTAAGDIDFLNVFMHELSHGLGFSNFVDEGTGLSFIDGATANNPDVYMHYTRDNSTGKIWDQLTPAQIVAAAVKTGQQVWDGANVTGRAPNVLGPLVLFNVTLPASLKGEYEYGTASFGAVPTPANFSGDIVAGVPNDGCSALTNAGAVSGKLALVQRGGCTFVVKAKNAQLAGAKGVIIANNPLTVGGGPFGMGGADPTVTIPAISLSTQFGVDFIAANTVGNGALKGSATRLAGADAAGRVRLYAPSVYEPGSSISHYDTAASPNLLMEPAITPTLTAATNVDLTAALFQDIGWKTELSVAGCGTGSGAPATTVSGFNLASPVFICADGAKNKGDFQSCSVQYFNVLKKNGVISGAYSGKFSSCTASGK
jgi:hypothetical protein